MVANEEEKVETANAVDLADAEQLNNVEISDNVVLRKLLVSSNICFEMPY